MTEEQLIRIDERIDSYLRGQMTKEEESQFISDCKNNRELKERAYLTALIVKALKTINKMDTYTLITKLLEQLSYDENTAKNPNENYLKAIANAANALIELKKFY